ncbi:MAG: hypothetical protein KIS92_20115 [Planctomycetota bacterium]|nr:hypothetical protein [Planctomycetota bacterium]
MGEEIDMDEAQDVWRRAREQERRARLERELQRQHERRMARVAAGEHPVFPAPPPEP